MAADIISYGHAREIDQEGWLPKPTFVAKAEAIIAHDETTKPAY